MTGGAGRRPRVLIAGAFGQGNPGDQSVLDAFVSHLPGSDVSATVSSLAPGPQVRPYTPVPVWSRTQVARAVLEADLTVLTATVLKRLHPATGRHSLGLLANTLAVAALARAAGKPVALAGVGVGDLSGAAAHKLARAIVDAAGLVEMRDEESAVLLRRAGIMRDLRIGSDVAWATAPTPGRRGGRRQLAVITTSYMAGDEPLVSSLQHTAAVLSGAGYEVAVQPWQRTKDAAMATALRERAGVPISVWEAPPDVSAAVNRLAPAAVVVGLRFHSLVAAGAAGVPFVAVTHEPKLAGLARRLGQPGVSPTAAPAELADAALHAAAGPPPRLAMVRQEGERAAALLDRVAALARERSVRFGAGLKRKPVMVEA